MRSSLKLILACGALWAGLAFAKPPQEFQAPQQMSEEEIAASKARSKSPINEYGKDVTQEVKPPPWGEITFFGIVLLVALPFGLRAFRDTSREIAGNSAFGARGRARPDQ